jgi:hypothetical protein
MNDESDVLNGIHLSPTALVLIVGAALSGGAGVSGIFQPRADQEALEACYDNSRIAINVAAQHGEEIQTLRGRIDIGTRDRYTASDARKDKESHRDEHYLINKRLEYLENKSDK